VPSTKSIPRPVWFLGVVSLFTDAATEIIYPLLPIYLSRVLGAAALSLGVIEGVAEGVNSLLKIVSGWWSDRRAKRRPIVILGYTLSSLARPLDRAGYELDPGAGHPSARPDGQRNPGRSPRRDAHAVCRRIVARPHLRFPSCGWIMRGAIIGPLIANRVSVLHAGQYRVLFMLTAITGALAVATLFFVREPEREMPPPVAKQHASAQDAPLPMRLYVVLGIILALQPRELRRRVSAAAFVRCAWCGHVRAAALGGAARGEGVVVDVGAAGYRIALAADA
jgi:hypothetical protein